MTNARNKLNAATIQGIVLIAGVFALLTRSWIVFLLLAIVLAGTSFLSGDIRIRSRRR
ncbi:hypothetical protein Pan216_03990 [Planctomycetes bacterium Pan216]|uniref:Uncharacterized protein n=1 Tax=Kolteria novifilia TaxID=2527975 RepID=A0A518AXW3_9BACT|nr:hypothetical protein Pan216_03990 [Planctomycetes bacterium Pan216]